MPEKKLRWPPDNHYRYYTCHHIIYNTFIVHNPQYLLGCCTCYLIMQQNKTKHKKNNRKPSIFSPSTKIKTCTSSKAPPTICTSSTYIHKTMKSLCIDCPGTTLVPDYRPKFTFDLKNSNLQLAVLALK